MAEYLEKFEVNIGGETHKIVIREYKEKDSDSCISIDEEDKSLSFQNGHILVLKKYISKYHENFGTGSENIILVAEDLSKKNGPLIVGTVVAISKNVIVNKLTVKGSLITALRIHESYRRFGLGSRLMLNLEKKAVSGGISFFYLHIVGENNPASKLYDKLGYSKGVPTTSQEVKFSSKSTKDYTRFHDDTKLKFEEIPKDIVLDELSTHYSDYQMIPADWQEFIKQNQYDVSFKVSTDDKSVEAGVIVFKQEMKRVYYVDKFFISTKWFSNPFFSALVAGVIIGIGVGIHKLLGSVFKLNRYYSEGFATFFGVIAASKYSQLVDQIKVPDFEKSKGVQTYSLIGGYYKGDESKRIKTLEFLLEKSKERIGKRGALKFWMSFDAHSPFTHIYGFKNPGSLFRVKVLQPKEGLVQGDIEGKLFSG